jgi:phosphatidylserine/phosphatidylglycerophosphate/cardiolipin synthase-like enzyme
MSFMVFNYQLLIFLTIFFAWRRSILLGFLTTFFWVIYTYYFVDYRWGTLVFIQAFTILISTPLGFLSRTNDNPVGIFVNNRLLKSNKSINKISEFNLDHLEKTEYEVIEKPEVHRKELIETIKKSKHTIVIWSGWATTYSIDRELVDLFKDALERGVNIYAGFGYNTSRNYTPRQSDTRGIEELNKLKLFGKEKRSRGYFLIGKKDNHKKILICDDEYVIVGSFNWLSNSSNNRNDEESIKIFNKTYVSEALARNKSDIIKLQ